MKTRFRRVLSSYVHALASLLEVSFCSQKNNRESFIESSYQSFFRLQTPELEVLAIISLHYGQLPIICTLGLQYTSRRIVLSRTCIQRLCSFQCFCIRLMSFFSHPAAPQPHTIQLGIMTTDVPQTKHDESRCCNFRLSSFPVARSKRGKMLHSCCGVAFSGMNII